MLIAGPIFQSPPSRSRVRSFLQRTKGDDGMDLRKLFGGHIRRLRKGRLLTQEELAARSGISADGVRRIESGTSSPGLHTIGKLAAALGISLTLLFVGLEADRSLP